MAVKFGQLNSVTKTGFEPQKWNIYSKQHGTLFLTTKETKEILEELHVTQDDHLTDFLDDMTAETETGHSGLNLWWNMTMMMMYFEYQSY
jgi:hypothetical protein